MNKIIRMIFMSLVVIALIGCDDNTDKNEAKTPSASSTQKGIHYEEVIDAFEKAGFTNIQTERMEDLIVGWLTNDGDIEYVSVDGNKNFSPNTAFPNDVEVIIAYHTFPADEDDTANDDSNNENAQDMNKQENDENEPKSKAEEIYENAIGSIAIDVYEALQDEDIDVAFLHEVTRMDFSEEVVATSDPDDKNNYLPWEITGLDDFDSDKKAATLLINTEEVMDQTEQDKETLDALKEQLHPSFAWGAVTDYGLNEYTYGFKLNMITGTMAETAVGENTWFLKSRCQIKNESGIWQKNLTCEAYVTGTDEQPEVIDFKVY